MKFSTKINIAIYLYSKTNNYKSICKLGIIEVKELHRLLRLNAVRYCDSNSTIFRIYKCISMTPGDVVSYMSDSKDSIKYIKNIGRDGFYVNHKVFTFHDKENIENFAMYTLSIEDGKCKLKDGQLAIRKDRYKYYIYMKH